tara:strand:+ start:811 stop:1671 length:861 start_codon:yes stop_codon:yes gene_type:complete
MYNLKLHAYNIISYVFKRGKMTTRGYFNFEWGQLHYRSVSLGSKLPLLVMMHQSPLSSRNYDALLPYLAEQFQVIAIDTPGFGNSDRLNTDWEVKDYANLAFECANKLGQETFYLFGRATGSVFALEALLLNPKRINKLILHGIPVYTPDERKQRLADFAPPYEILDDGSHLKWIWDRIHNEYPWIDAELATNNLKDFLDCGPDFAASYRSIWRHDLPERVGELINSIHNAILLIAGENDRIGFMHERAVKLLPSAEVEFIEKATDFVAEQNPKLFSQILINFLKN